MKSTTKVQGVTITRGEVSLTLDHGCLMYILGLFCNVATLVLNVTTLQRRDVNLTLFWNVATLAFHVATLVFHSSGMSRR